MSDLLERYKGFSYYNASKKFFCEDFPSTFPFLFSVVIIFENIHFNLICDLELFLWRVCVQRSKRVSYFRAFLFLGDRWSSTFGQLAVYSSLRLFFDLFAVNRGVFAQNLKFDYPHKVTRVKICSEILWTVVGFI